MEKSVFAPSVTKAWDFLSKVAMRQDTPGRLGYCQCPGAGPAYASARFDSNSTTDYCVGMMLLASAEVAVMVGEGLELEE